MIKGYIFKLLINFLIIDQKENTPYYNKMSSYESCDKKWRRSTQPIKHNVL